MWPPDPASGFFEYESFSGTSLFQIRVQETLCHFLDPRVFMGTDPCGGGEIECQFPVRDWAVIPFANIDEAENTGGGALICVARTIKRSRNREAERVPGALLRSPRTTAGVPKIAEGFEHVLGRDFSFMAGRGAMAVPSTTERKARRMRPGAILQFHDRHEIRTGQCSSLKNKVLPGLVILISCRRFCLAWSRKRQSRNCSNLVGRKLLWTALRHSTRC